MRNELSLFNDSFFNDGFSIFNSLLAQSRAQMETLLNDPNTKVYRSPDGTTTVCYSSKEYSNKNCIPTRTKKSIITHDYPITDAWEDENGGFGACVFLAGFKPEQVYMDYQDGYINVIATRGKAWKDVLVANEKTGTYDIPDEFKDDEGKKEIKNYTYIQKQSKENPIEVQNILFDTTKYDITKLEKSVEDGVLTITAPAKEEAKPRVLTFND